MQKMAGNRCQTSIMFSLANTLMALRSPGSNSWKGGTKLRPRNVRHVKAAVSDWNSYRHDVTRWLSASCCMWQYVNDVQDGDSVAVREGGGMTKYIIDQGVNCMGTGCSLLLTGDRLACRCVCHDLQLQTDGDVKSCCPYTGCMIYN